MSDKNILIGAWKLITFEFRRNDESVIHPYGKKARGSIIYTESGRYSAQLIRHDRPRFAISDQMQGTSEEITAAFKGCISYFGVYEVDLEYHKIIHHVEGSIFPNMEGTKQIRMFEIFDDHMTLTTPAFKLDGEKAVGVLEWNRVK